MAFYDVLLHIDVNEQSRLMMVIKNAVNYLNALPGEKFEIAIVANGGAVKLFTKENTEGRKAAEPLLDKGNVQFKLCNNALRENHLAPDMLWPECIVVPAGLVEVTRLQRAGFAYIKP